MFEESFQYLVVEVINQKSLENDLNQRWNDEGTASKNLNYNIYEIEVMI